VAYRRRKLRRRTAFAIGKPRTQSEMRGQVERHQAFFGIFDVLKKPRVRICWPTKPKEAILEAASVPLGGVSVPKHKEPAKELSHQRRFRRRHPEYREMKDTYRPYKPDSATLIKRDLAGLPRAVPERPRAPTNQWDEYLRPPAPTNTRWASPTLLRSTVALESNDWRESYLAGLRAKNNPPPSAPQPSAGESSRPQPTRPSQSGISAPGFHRSRIERSNPVLGRARPYMTPALRPEMPVATPPPPPSRGRGRGRGEAPPEDEWPYF
jgi:hypothetical protein